MLRKLTILVTLLSFFPAAVGAQDLAVLGQSPLAIERPADQQPAPEINLSPRLDRQAAANILAANDLQGGQLAAAEQPRKTHYGLTFKEFCEVHFGEYRWIYWAGAVAALVALHVVVAD
jgi:hypothetical protein